jgi:hypothetical protein
MDPAPFDGRSQLIVDRFFIEAGSVRCRRVGGVIMRR